MLGKRVSALVALVIGVAMMAMALPPSSVPARDIRPIIHEDNLTPIPLTRAERRDARSAPCIKQADDRYYNVLYVYPDSATSRYADVANDIRLFMGGASDMIDASAAETGGSLQLRILHDDNCQMIVTELALPLGLMRDFFGLLDYAQTNGYASFAEPYTNAIMFLDDGAFCGVGTIFDDDSDSPDNWNNGGGSLSVVGVNCWGANVAMHEVGHNAGAVQQSAPHRTPGWHCTDEWDVMCYNDGTGTTTVVCPDSSLDNRYDCNDDDYFNTNPVAGSYLDTHWNPAAQPWRFYIVPPDETPTPEPTPTETPSPTPEPTETPTVTPEPTETPTVTPEPTETPEPTVTPEPNKKNKRCKKIKNDNKRERCRDHNRQERRQSR